MSVAAASSKLRRDAAAGRRRFSAYPSYRPSGVGWLPSIPSGWNIKRLRYALTFPTKSEIRGLPPGRVVSFVPMEAVGEYGGLSLEQTKVIEDVLNGYTYFRDGDVVVAKITPCFENGKGALAEGLEGGIGFGTTELHVLRAGPELDRRYLFYLTLGEDFRKLGTAEMYGAGGQKRVPESFIRELRHPIPPLDEQRAIAGFLDGETARIDALIAKKQRLIELIQEKRTALISHAVTKGLDPNAPMKPSGVDWLGDIPWTWTTKRLKFAFHFLNNRRVPLSALERADMERTYPYYGASGIIDHVDSYLFDEPLILVAEDGANLYSRSTPLAFIASGLYWVNNHAHILKPRFGSLLFWESLLQTVQYDPWISGSAQPKLTKENLGSIPLPIPPNDEIAAIASFVETTNKRLSPLVAATTHGIDRLSEYRSALISAAVTGKIDVCEELAHG